MATDTPTKAATETHQFDTSLVEDVAADLQNAEAFLDCTENLLSDIRRLFDAMGHDPSKFRDFLNLDIMIYETQEKVRNSRDRLSGAVEEHFAAIRAAKV